MDSRRTFTAEFKLEAIKLALSPGNSIVQVAADLGVGKSTLTNWIRNYREKGGAAFPDMATLSSHLKKRRFNGSKRSWRLLVRNGIS